jgi:hypothetical protein
MHLALASTFLVAAEELVVLALTQQMAAEELVVLVNMT